MGQSQLLKSRVFGNWPGIPQSRVCHCFRKVDFLYRLGGASVFKSSCSLSMLCCPERMNPALGLSSSETSDNTIATVNGKTNIVSKNRRFMLYPKVKQASTDIRTSTNQIAPGIRFSSAARLCSLRSDNAPRACSKKKGVKTFALCRTTITLCCHITF